MLFPLPDLPMPLSRAVKQRLKWNILPAAAVIDAQYGSSGYHDIFASFNAGEGVLSKTYGNPRCALPLLTPPPRKLL